MVRALKDLEAMIPISFAFPSPENEGWLLVNPDRHSKILMEVYQSAAANYFDRATVPMLWDE